METTSASVSQASVFTSMTGVHAAWLAAGTNSDAAAMLQLHSQFPEWLDFNRVLGRRVDVAIVNNRDLQLH